MPPAVVGGTQPAAQLPDGSKAVSDRSAGRSRRCRAGCSPPAGADAAAELGPDRIGCIDPGLSGSRPESPFSLRTTQPEPFLPQKIPTKGWPRWQPRADRRKGGCSCAAQDGGCWPRGMVYLYHERQEAALCGQHCLNNLLQGRTSFHHDPSTPPDDPRPCNRIC